MTIQANYYPLGDVGNGSTTTFALSWPFRAQSDIVVQLLDASGNLVSPAPVLNGGGTYDYVITGTPDPNTGFYASANVVFNTAPPAGYEVLRYRATQDWQDKSLPTNGRFPAKSVESALDRRTLVDQEQDYANGGSGASVSGGRVVRMYPYDLSSFNPVLPNTQGQGGNVLVVKADGSGWNFENIGNAIGVTGIVGTAAQITVSGPDGAGNLTLSLAPNIRVPITTGTSGQGSIGFTRGGTVVVAGLGLTDTAFTPAGMFVGDQMFVNSGAASGGMVIVTQAAAPIKFGISSSEVARFTTGGQLLVGSANPITDNSANPLQVSANYNSGAVFKMQNLNAGNGAYGGLYVQNDASKNLFLAMYSSGYTAAGWLPANSAALWTDGANGLTVGTAAAAPLRLAVNAIAVGTLTPQGGGGYLVLDAQTANLYSLQLKNSASGTTGQMRMGVSSGAGSLINGDAQNDANIYMSIGNNMNFSIDNGTSLAMQIKSGGWLVARGGFQGAAPANQHDFFSNYAGNAVLVPIHEDASNPFGVQAMFTATPNDSGHWFFQGMAGFGTTYATRVALYSNGGIGNYSANNVNLSDARAKSEIEIIADDAKLGAALWESFKRVDWGRFKFSDQSHDDFNFGYTAQGVAKAFAKVAPQLVTQWIAEGPQPNVPEGVEMYGRDFLGVYEHDLYNIGGAVLAMAQARIEELEAKIKKLERTKH